MHLLQTLPNAPERCFQCLLAEVHSAMTVEMTIEMAV